jgi:hypothetical protein
MRECRWLCSMQLGYIRIGALLMILGGLACTKPAGSADSQRPFSIVMLPDTQNYLPKWPESFVAQTDWIRRNRDQESIAFVTHVGDVVNDPNGSDEWRVADKAMSQLDGVVPWGVCLGNHDYYDHGETRGATGFLQHFGPQRFQKNPWYGGVSDNGLNSYQLFSAGGTDFVVLHLELGVPDPAIAWAKQVLAKHSSRAAIVSTHSYLHGLDGVGRSVKEGPNSGEDVWNKLVRDHPQIFMVLCGHITDAVEYYQISVNDAGNKVLEMLADYQKRNNGGDGWLRLIRIVPESREIRVRTYSPVLDKWETDADSQFVVPFVLPAQCKTTPGRVPQSCSAIWKGFGARR